METAERDGEKDYAITTRDIIDFLKVQRFASEFVPISIVSAHRRSNVVSST